MAFRGMWFKMRIKPFWHYKACDSKCHSGPWGSKCEYLAGSIQTLNMSSASLSLLLSAELNHSIVRHRVQNGITKHVIQMAFRGMWFKMRIKPFNCVQNGITKHLVRNGHFWIVLQKWFNCASAYYFRLCWEIRIWNYSPLSTAMAPMPTGTSMRC